MSNYAPQPIQIRETAEQQNFRKNSVSQVTDPKYPNTYIRDGTALALPFILIKRLANGSEFTVVMFDLEDNFIGGMTNPGFGNNFLDDPVDAYEMATFDRGDWTMADDVPDGYYYLKFFSADDKVWWSDEIYITAEGTVPGFPPDCDGHGFLKLRWSDAQCVYSGLSTDEITKVLAYPSGMDFFCYLPAAAFVDSTWDVDTQTEPTGSSAKVVKRFGEKRWKLKGAPVSEAIIDAMQSSAFFKSVKIYIPNLEDPYLSPRLVQVNSSTENEGVTYSYEYTFVDDYLLQQGCC